MAKTNATNYATIVIPCRDCAATIDITLLSLRAAIKRFQGEATPSRKIEVVLVANGTTTEFKNYFRSLEDVTTIESDVGRSKARNAGLQYAKMNGSKFVLFIDADTVVADDFLASMLEALEAPARPAAVAARLEPTVIGWNVARTTLRSLAFAQTKGTYISLFRESSLGVFVDTAASGFSVEALIAIGGFDETLIRQEDMDLSIRMAKAGYRFGVVRKAHAVKIVDDSVPGQSLIRAFHSGYHLAALYKKWRPGDSTLSRLNSVRRNALIDFNYAKSANHSFSERFFVGSFLLSNRLGNLAGVLIFSSEP